MNNADLIYRYSFIMEMLRWNIESDNAWPTSCFAVNLIQQKHS